MVQVQILNKIIKSKNLDIVTKNDLTPAYFGDYAKEFKFIINHVNKYGNVPDMATFLDAFPEFSIMDVEESDKYLIDTITEDFQYRLIVPLLHKTAELVQTNSIDAIDYIRSELDRVKIDNTNVYSDIVKDADVRLQEYLNKKNIDEPWMRPTGFKELDDAIGGLSPGEEFVVIVARTNNGKSWVLCKIAEHNWKYGANVGYISPEMSANAIGYRFDTLNEHFSNFDLYTGRDVGDYESYINNLRENAKNSFIVATPRDFNNNITVQKLRNFCITHSLDLLCIDGITYLTDERYHRGDNKTTSLTNISEDLMNLSCELKIPIIAVVQANRNGVEENGDVPQLESIRDSDGIAHNASKVISLRQKDNKLKIEVTKARNCKVGTKLMYRWEIDTGYFEFEVNGEFNEEEEEESSNSNSNNNHNSHNYHRQEKEVELKQPLHARGSTGSISDNFEESLF
jgi:replicative DNA helicase